MNFVFFFPDEMKASSVSCYGNKHVKMPNFDRLAQNGVRFDNCFVQNPVCTPSRCCLMTGRYVHNDAHRTLWHLLRSHEPSLFRDLKNSGYDIAWYGKNDLYSQDYLKEICTDLEEKRNGYKTPTSLSSGMVCKGENPYSLDDPMYYSFLYNPIATKNNEMLWDENVARGIDFIKSRKEDSNPFFLYLPLTMPHPPYNTIESFYNMYKAEDVKGDLIVPEETKNRPLYQKLIREYRNMDNMDKDIEAKVYAVYLAMNSYVDAMLGGIMDALDEMNLTEETTVIVSSDHGDWAGNYGLLEKWPNAMDDDIVRVPCIVSSPGNKKGHVVNEPIELIDIMPTVLELAGIKINRTIYAKSFAEQLKGASADPNRYVFCEGGYDETEPYCSEACEEMTDRLPNISAKNNNYYPKLLQQKEHPESVCRSVMIRSLEYKLVRRSTGAHEFYDLKKDPRETTNVYGDKQYDSVVMEMEKALLDWYLKTTDAVPVGDDPRGYK